ncbi:Ribonuclease H-like superfamily protein [Rhynchospora pubera]|uniref:Ribonuclease H-like superfamily protein n=1 Tax=Rhynchospora pubera TaxID=906938 RepID=A0AAV8C6S7_9POAL|nr:Ribonuclease H-like superfamily protein [Rhynchospora pubera]
MGQPWFDMWAHFPPTNAAQRRITISQLVDDESGNWNNQKLIELYGFYGALYIAMSYPNGPPLSQRQDTLIFTFNRNGQFSIKGAYNLLLNASANANAIGTADPVNKFIWHVESMLPRTRIFIWKAVKEALPVDDVFAKRLAKQSRGCSVCGAQQETAAHALFKCPRAQQVWLMSDFNLRTDGLPDKLHDILTFLISSLNDQQMAKLAAIMWTIWKDRCKEVFEGKKGNARQTLASAQNLLHTLQVAANQFTKLTHHSELPVPDTAFKCWIDASWVHEYQDGSGLACALFDQGNLVFYKLSVTKSTSPFHAELLALKMAMQHVTSMGLTDVSFYTDCKELQQVISGATCASQVNWLAYHDAVDAVTQWDTHKKENCFTAPFPYSFFFNNLEKHHQKSPISFLYIPNCVAFSFLSKSCVLALFLSLSLSNFRPISQF